MNAILDYVMFSIQHRSNVTQVFGQSMAGLKSAAGFLRRQLGSNLRLRYAPEIVWEEDDSITYGAKMLELINSLGLMMKH